MPQYSGIIHDLTLLDNLKLVSEIHIKEELREQIKQLITQFEFETLLKIKSKIYQVVKKACDCDGTGKCPKILLLDDLLR